ncbi:leukocyte immunoglobulin-like receptor subfamily B member 4A isoform X2 [Apodemus sylvaticus]|uniref:leukocyte immunoglobulin-like receptor subfamily B member 4A isoform X2 n=1 Tax=Apodemus sylvaticus TaxID=10129 RepID=UPI0022439CAC|nr:leukocyte immunoglobulin-like receptor subfamily B member 4A isoform X2 [Apodemus sylvaticus]XP_052022909.1 leukocyte immunoglobulin-like receptor subfamily B member 4A isoform X2 [Apodemus sylvaticus]
MTSTYCLMLQNICQIGPGQQLRTLLGLTMMVILTGLLFLGFIVEHWMAGQAGHLPKPIIWAEPGSVIALHTPVIIWCQGSWEAQEYRLFKEQNGYPWDTKFPLDTRNKAKFNIQQMTTNYAGIYKCYYRSTVGDSEHSDVLELVVTGAHEKPSLSVWPSTNVTSGVSIAFTCSSYMGFGRFILIQEGKHHLSWTLDSQHQASQPFHATFVLTAATLNHNGTFTCYGSYRNEPQVWSTSSDPLDLMVSDTKDPSTSPTEDGLGTHWKIMTGVMASFLLLLFFILLCLILIRHWCWCKRTPRTQLELREC